MVCRASETANITRARSLKPISRGEAIRFGGRAVVYTGMDYSGPVCDSARGPRRGRKAQVSTVERGRGVAHLVPVPGCLHVIPVITQRVKPERMI